VGDARAEVTGWVDGVPRRTTEARADADHEEGDGQSTERREAGGVAVVAEADHHEDQHERADDLGDEVPRVAADGRACREDAELVGRVRLLVEVLLVRQPGEDGTDDRTEELRQDVQRHRAEVDVYERVGRLRSELGRSVGHEAERHRRVQMCAGVVSDDDAREHRDAPADVHHQEPAVEALVLDECDVSHDTGTEEDQHCRAHQLRQEIYTDIVHVDLPVVRLTRTLLCDEV